MSPGRLRRRDEGRGGARGCCRFHQLRGLPVVIHFHRGEVVDALSPSSRLALNELESCGESVRGETERLLRIHLDVPGDVDQGKQQVAQLRGHFRGRLRLGFGSGRPRSRIGDGLLEFRNFFLHFANPTRAARTCV